MLLKWPQLLYSVSMAMAATALPSVVVFSSRCSSPSSLIRIDCGTATLVQCLIAANLLTVRGRVHSSGVFAPIETVPCLSTVIGKIASYCPTTDRNVHDVCGCRCVLNRGVGDGWILVGLQAKVCSAWQEGCWQVHSAAQEGDATVAYKHLQEAVKQNAEDPEFVYQSVMVEIRQGNHVGSGDICQQSH